MRTLILFLLVTVSTFAQGTCPSGLPVTGTNCFFIAGNGADTNTGTDESHPWAHAPYMPNCTGSCATEKAAIDATCTGGPGSGRCFATGLGFIFRGGDTWHFGITTDSANNPASGGTWNLHFGGTNTNCDVTDNPNYLSNGTSCAYVGVDKNWFSGASWTRPIMNGDNPTSTSAVGSCAHQTGIFLHNPSQTFFIVDNFEWTGQCNSGTAQYYISENDPVFALTQTRYSNNYFHGITHVAFSCPGSVCEGNIAVALSMGNIFGPGNVCDGADSDATAFTCMSPQSSGGPFIAYDNVFENQSQMVANGCHIWHDNVWQGYTFSGDGVAHGNQMECNGSAPASLQGFPEPTSTHNLFYNNVMGHNSGTDGDVKLQLAVNNNYPYYVFNNIFYDQGSGNQLNWGGTGITLPTGSQFFFNNTFEAATNGDVPSCFSSTTYINNHIIAEGGPPYFQAGSCTQTTNVGMNHATAVTQGYMANGKGTSGHNSNITCANDVTPCAPTSNLNSTVAVATNEQTLCNNLLASTDPVVQRAGTACQSDTTDGCSYNLASHTVSCPSRTVLLHPVSAVWDAGGYQFTVAPPSSAPAPTMFAGTVTSQGTVTLP